MVSSAFGRTSLLSAAEVLPTSDAWSQASQQETTSPIPDLEAPLRRASYQPPFRLYQLRDPIWSHGSRTKFASRWCHPNATSQCIFHRVSRTITMASLHHEVITVNEQSDFPFHMHKQCRIAEALDETVLLQYLRIMRLPTCQRPMACTVPYLHFLTKPTYSRSCPFSRASNSFSSYGSSTNTIRTGAP